jgi:DNA invertase Pin-like site-specific DNA recombinase
LGITDINVTKIICNNTLPSTLLIQGGHLQSLKESWLDTKSSHGKMLFTLFAGIAQFERDHIAVRTKEGIVAAKKIRKTKMGYDHKKTLRGHIGKVFTNS